MSDTDQALNSCGCCAGVQALTPVSPENAPGLSALLYRVGTYGSFNESMLAAIASTPGINALTTREPDDPAVSLIDAWACALDVLTFYQERIANEGFLRTAAERLSLLSLANSIGYRLSPGVAASAFLAFTLETGPGRPDSVSLDIGTKAQSTPAQNQLPQTFETIEPIEARPEWNLLKPRARQLVYPVTGDSVLYLDGLATQLKTGDPVLLVGDERVNDVLNRHWDVRRVASITLDNDNNCTIVTLDSPLSGATPLPNFAAEATGSAAVNPKFYALRQRAQFFGYNAPEWKVMPSNIQAVYNPPSTTVVNFADWPGLSIGGVGGFADHTNASGIVGQYYSTGALKDAVFHRVDGTIDFNWGAGTPDPRLGHNFFAYWAGYIILPAGPAGAVVSVTITIDTPDTIQGSIAGKTFSAAGTGTTGFQVSLNLGLKAAAVPFQIHYRRTSASAGIHLSWNSGGSKVVIPATALGSAFLYPVQLDQAYPKLLNGTWAALANPNGTELFEVVSVGEDSRTEFTVTAKTTRATLSGFGMDNFDQFLRQTSVYAQSESLDFATQPITTIVNGSFIDLDSEVDGLVSGRTLLISGTSADDGASAGEMAVLDSTQLQNGVTRLVFANALQHNYVRSSVSIYANVARATNGETKTETLGSANASTPFQTFKLQQKPLTYVSAATATGGQSTLSVRVNNLLWNEVSSLFDAGPQDRVYVTSIADPGDVTIQFGDGVNGARPPSGSSNVQATYRVGTGLAGLLAANQINLPMSRPLGLKYVTNPLAPSGAADPETRDEARRNAPMTVLTLGRIVSLQDYEDFARAFSGIGKSKATLLWQDDHTVVHITIATADGQPVDPTSDLYANLTAAIDLDRDPAAKVYLAGYDPLTFGLAAEVLIDKPTYLPDLVMAAVETALTGAFSFDNREFAQAVAESEVVAVIQNVPGVIAVRLTSLYDQDSGSSNPHPLASVLPARPARWDSVAGVAVMKPAQMLTIDPNEIGLTEMKQP